MADGELDVDALYRKYGHSVLRRARQILRSDADARDTLQEIFASLVARPAQFEQRSRPSTFLYAMTTHACLQRLRDVRNQLRLVDEHVKPWTTEIDLRSPEAGAIVRDLLGQLPADQAAAVIYHHLDGMSHAEIAELLACSPRHVGDLLARAQAHKEAS